MFCTYPQQAQAHENNLRKRKIIMDITFNTKKIPSPPAATYSITSVGTTNSTKMLTTQVSFAATRRARGNKLPQDVKHSIPESSLKNCIKEDPCSRSLSFFVTH